MNTKKEIYELIRDTAVDLITLIDNPPLALPRPIENNPKIEATMNEVIETTTIQKEETLINCLEGLKNENNKKKLQVADTQSIS